MMEVAVVPNGHPNGNVDIDMEFLPKDGALRFASGLILPPPEIKCEHPPSHSRPKTIILSQMLFISQPQL